jgi:hypothetical protein
VLDLDAHRANLELRVEAHSSMGDDWKTVYFCARTSLGMFKAKIPGVPVPVTKKG